MARLFTKETHYGFMAHAKLFLGLSLVLMVVSLIATVVLEPNYGIDFSGGTQMRVEFDEGVSVGEVREVLNATIAGDISVTTQSGAPEGRVGMIVKIASTGEEAAMNEAEISTLRTALKEAFPSVDIRGIDSIGGAVSGELVMKGIIAISVTLLAIGIYIWFRFEAAFALGAIFALLHDVVLTLGFFVLTRFTFDLSIVAALLAIIGYSLNDTVVVYDRIREKLATSKTEAIDSVIDRGINETLRRTLMTSGTTLLAILALLFFGGEVLRGFSIAMLFGVVVGTYSSIFIASPIVRYIGIDRNDKPKSTTKFADIDA